MTILCKIGRHDFVPVKVFSSIYGQYEITNWVGNVCTHCGKRIIAAQNARDRIPHVQTQQQAYDWLNGSEKPKAQVLTLVKGGKP